MSLTDAQLTTLGNDIRGNTDQAVIDALAAGAIGVIRDWYNADSTFWAWRNSVSPEEVGNAIDLANLGNIVAANSERLQAAFTVRVSFSGADAPTRAFFSDMFSAAAGDESRPQLRDTWQRVATEAEAVLATGTGTQATGEISNTTGLPAAGSPGTLVWEGALSTQDVIIALELTAP